MVTSYIEPILVVTGLVKLGAIALATLSQINQEEEEEEEDESLRACDGINLVIAFAQK